MASFQLGSKTWATTPRAISCSSSLLNSVPRLLIDNPVNRLPGLRSFFLNQRLTFGSLVAGGAINLTVNFCVRAQPFCFRYPMCSAFVRPFQRSFIFDISIYRMDWNVFLFFHSIFENILSYLFNKI